MFVYGVSVVCAMMILTANFNSNAYAARDSKSSHEIKYKLKTSQDASWVQSPLQRKAFVEMKRKKIMVLFENKVIDDGSLVELYNQVSDRKAE